MHKKGLYSTFHFVRKLSNCTPFEKFLDTLSNEEVNTSLLDKTVNIFQYCKMKLYRKTFYSLRYTLINR